MIIIKHFCTCHDEVCALHPCNHDSGCDPCIRKNLASGEVPTCMFRAVSDDLSGVAAYTIDGFVDFCLRQREAGKTTV